VVAVGAWQVISRFAELDGTETVTPPLNREGGSGLCIKCAASIATGSEVTSCASVSRLIVRPTTAGPAVLCCRSAPIGLMLTAAVAA
jgi:hypothetical protein